MRFLERLKEWAKNPNNRFLKGLAGFVIFGTGLFFTGSLWVAFALWVVWKCVTS